MVCAGSILLTWFGATQTPGEDPVRIKGYAKALLAGLEGNGAIRKVVATCKHYAAYDLERWKGVVRYRFNAIVSTQDLSEYYLPPFQQCARDSKVGSFMCSYNALNGTPACASEYLMTDILRNHWGWTEHNNFITSDCNAIQVGKSVPESLIHVRQRLTLNNRTSCLHWVTTTARRRPKQQQTPSTLELTQSAKSQATHP